MVETTVRETGSGSAKAQQQRLINAVEKRLSLPGGTLMIEIAADLVNRLGKSPAILRKANDILEVARGPGRDGKFDKVTSDQMRVEGKKLKEHGEELFRKERAEFHKKALDYITKQYGEETKDDHNHAMGYGDRIEISKKRHLRKIW